MGVLQPPPREGSSDPVSHAAVSRFASKTLLVETPPRNDFGGASGGFLQVISGLQNSRPTSLGLTVGLGLGNNSLSNASIAAAITKSRVARKSLPSFLTESDMHSRDLTPLPPATSAGQGPARPDPNAPLNSPERRRPPPPKIFLRSDKEASASTSGPTRGALDTRKAALAVVRPAPLITSTSSVAAAAVRSPTAEKGSTPTRLRNAARQLKKASSAPFLNTRISAPRKIRRVRTSPIPETTELGSPPTREPIPLSPPAKKSTRWGGFVRAGSSKILCCFFPSRIAVEE